VGQLIDTSVWVGLERRGRLPEAIRDLAPDEPIALAAITASELIVGIHRADSPARKRGRTSFVERIFAAIPVLPFDLPVARRHAQLWADLAAVGLPIGVHDSLIAATALTHGYAVLTENPREFQRVPGLVVRRPTW
jgi:tRNA(fMet)-specific endonuclease VapC